MGTFLVAGLSLSTIDAWACPISPAEAFLQDGIFLQDRKLPDYK